MYKFEDIQANFSKAQKFLNQFGNCMKVNDKERAGQMVSFAMGHLQEIIQIVRPEAKTEVKVKPKDDIIIHKEEPAVEINENDFLLSVD